MNPNRKIFYILVIISMLWGGYFLRDYFSLIALAALTVLLFNPVYEYLLKIFKGKQGPATGITIFIAFLCLVIPVILVSVLSYYQITTVITDIRNSSLVSQSSSVQEITDKMINRVNEVISGLPNGESYKISSTQVIDYLNTLFPKVANALLDFVRKIGGSVPSFITGVIIYIILLSSIFPNQERIIKYIKRISPLDDRIEQLYFSKIAAMAKSMVKGTFVIALFQGILGGIFLWLAGLPYTFFFIVALTFLSIIPLGGGIVSIPIGIYLLATGHVWEGIFVLSSHFAIITNIDNLLRPKFVSKDARIPSVLTLLAVFAGLDMFGWAGVIYGPVIMIFIVTTIQIYDKYYRIKLKDNSIGEELDIATIE